MKKAILIVTAMSMSTMFLAGTNHHSNILPKSTSVFQKKSGFRIDKTLTSNNGCVFEIHGDYTLTGGFTGTISVKCPNESKKTYTFGFIVPSGGNTVEYVSGDLDAWNFYIENDPDLKAQLAQAMQE